MNRPIGLTVLALLGFVQGSLGILGVLLTWLSGTLQLFTSGAEGGINLINLSFPWLIISLVTLWISSGLWRAQSWAWMWMVLIQIFNLVLGLVPLLFGSRLGVFGLFFSLISATILVYLFTPGPRSALMEPESPTMV